jgi:hypothetical protein
MHNDWAPVQFMIADIQQAERNAKYPASVIRSWDSAAHLFRFMEQRQLFEQTPTATDLKMHEALLHALISLGLILEIQTSDEDLAEFDIKRENLIAYIRELKDTFLMWHGPELEAAKAAELEKALYGDPS